MGAVDVGFSIFLDNQAVDGAGAYHSGFQGIRQQSTYRWTRFIDNVGTGSGAGQAFVFADSVVHNCGYFGNDGNDGGALFADNGSVVDVAGSLFSCNTALGGAPGGAMHIVQASLVHVMNCTLHGNNTAAGNGGGIALDTGAHSDIDNSILWENWDVTGMTYPAQIYIVPGSGATIALNYSDVQNLPGCPGAGTNICAFPQFVDADGADNICGTVDDDLSLAPASPCIDAADDNRVPYDVLDLDVDADSAEIMPLDVVGAPRFVDAPAPDSGLAHALLLLPIADMGAIEFPAPPVPCPEDLDGSGSVGAGDLAILLGDWGPCDDCANCPSDLDGDCVVGAGDLAIMLGAWGSC
jgi:hypothetical protein